MLARCWLHQLKLYMSVHTEVYTNWNARTSPVEKFYAEREREHQHKTFYSFLTATAHAHYSSGTDRLNSVFHLYSSIAEIIRSYTYVICIVLLKSVRLNIYSIFSLIHISIQGVTEQRVHI